MEITLGEGTVRRVLEANMVGDVDSTYAGHMHYALHHPVRSEDRGIATMLTVAAPPPAWGMLSRWAKARANRIRAGSTEGARVEARAMARLAVRVNRELDRLAAHPAYHGVAVVGVEPLILPAYRVRIVGEHVPGMKGESYVDFGPPAPTPDLAVKLADWSPGEVLIGEMLPFAFEVNGSDMTMWIWHQNPGTATHPE